MNRKLLTILLLIGLSLFVLPLVFSNQSVTKGENFSKETSNPTAFFLNKIQLSTGEELMLDDYIMGVVAAEMPASYELEALKAQAVAARTYAIYKTENLTKPIEITTAHQVYFPVNNLMSTYAEKVKNAVMQTSGEVIVYKDQIIEAMFHAASNGMTESAFNFSGKQVPYLQSVQSLEEKRTTHRFSLSEIKNLLNINITMQEILEYRVKRNSSNRVQTIEIGKYEWTGRAFREALSLASTDFNITVEGNVINIETKGYGHGVGMSQMGANMLAEQGLTYRDILAHYYTNTEIIRIQAPSDNE